MNNTQIPKFVHEHIPTGRKEEVNHDGTSQKLACTLLLLLTIL
jgi:hypothetical protein